MDDRLAQFFIHLLDTSVIAERDIPVFNLGLFVVFDTDDLKVFALFDGADILLAQ